MPKCNLNPILICYICSFGAFILSIVLYVDGWTKLSKESSFFISVWYNPSNLFFARESCCVEPFISQVLINRPYGALISHNHYLEYIWGRRNCWVSTVCLCVIKAKRKPYFWKLICIIRAISSYQETVRDWIYRPCWQCWHFNFLISFQRFPEFAVFFVFFFFILQLLPLRVATTHHLSPPHTVLVFFLRHVLPYYVLKLPFRPPSSLTTWWPMLSNLLPLYHTSLLRTFQNHFNLTCLTFSPKHPAHPVSLYYTNF